MNTAQVEPPSNMVVRHKSFQITQAQVMASNVTKLGFKVSCVSALRAG